MSNRRHPRQPVAAEDLACPDCDADVELTEVSPGLWSAVIRHDDTCPTYRAMEASR